MKKNLEIDVPRDADTEVHRFRGLKKSIFLRTRIALLSLVLVMAFSVVGTYAYLQWTGNQTPNRTSTGEVEINVVESINGGAEVTNTNQTEVTFGTDTKKVKFKAGTAENRVPEKLRVTFVPEVERTSNAGANAFVAEDWATAPVTDATGTYVKYGIFKLYLNSAWATDWTYSDGTFTYSKTLKKDQETPYLLMGVEVDVPEEDKDQYGAVKVNVIADVIQENSINTW